jgi:lipoyl(octanoyl) transferase
MKPVLLVDLGLVSYTEACTLQQRIVQARKAGEIDDVLLLCEHPHVITLGRNGRRENLLASEQELRQQGVEFHATNRGGDITYHGPGQVVGYPILDLTKMNTDVHWYVRSLEEIMIRASADFGITAFRVPGRTGIWVQSQGQNEGTEEKLAAIGIHLSRWVTSHGFAYNVATDLHYFDLIVPCGISDRQATSLEKLLSRTVAVGPVKSRLVHHLGELFSLKPRQVTFSELTSTLVPREVSDLTPAESAPAEKV